MVVFIWMGLIFYLSHQPASDSSALSGSLVQKFIAMVEVVTSITLSDHDWMYYGIRKGAHLFAYFLLAILTLFACRQTRVDRSKHGVIALVICVVYASTDEFHQLFIPGRSGEVTDVLIDTIGASIGIILFFIVEKGIRTFMNRA